jgi:MFS family permease
MNSTEPATPISLVPETSQVTDLDSQTVLSHTSTLNPRFSKDAVRTSLKASTVDGFCTAVFELITGGILLNNFLVKLGASPVVFGIMSSIPMLVNLFQPFGAYLSERRTSRFWYSIWTYGTSRILWLIMVLGIASALWGWIDYFQLEILTLFILLLSHFLHALGYASWLSWIATIVPRQIRGRYFGTRNSVICLTNLLCIPLTGLVVSIWPGGTLQGYGIVLLVAILVGMGGLVCQHFQVDVNPQVQNAAVIKSLEKADLPPHAPPQQNVTSEKSTANEKSVLQDSNGLMFLMYFGVWMFGVHLSTPFFDLYMLDRLNLDVGLVTLYGSLKAGANLLMLMVWGKLADRIGNHQTLVLVGMPVILTPILWLGIGNDVIDIWLWLPLLHLFIGGTWAALDLCNNNLQIGVAPIKNQSIYFSLVAAVGGISGALGTIVGGFVADNPYLGGIVGLFMLSSLFRFLSLIPLIFVHEPPRKSFLQRIQTFWQFRGTQEARS